MSDQLILGLFSSVVTLGVAGGGWWFAYKISKDEKRVRSLEATVKRLENDVRARIAFEKHVCKQISDNEQSTERAVQLRLRDEVFSRTGLRPKLTPSDVAEN